MKLRFFSLLFSIGLLPCQAIFSTQAIAASQRLAVVHFFPGTALQGEGISKTTIDKKHSEFEHMVQEALPRSSRQAEFKSFVFIQGFGEKASDRASIDRISVQNTIIASKNALLIQAMREFNPTLIFAQGAAATRLLMKEFPATQIIFTCNCNPLTTPANPSSTVCEPSYGEEKKPASVVGPTYDTREAILLGLDQGGWNIVENPITPRLVTGFSNYGLSSHENDQGEFLLTNAFEFRLKVLLQFISTNTKDRKVRIAAIFGNPYNNKRWCYREKARSLGVELVDVPVNSANVVQLSSMLKVANVVGGLVMFDSFVGSNFDVLSDAGRATDVPVLFPRGGIPGISKSAFGGWLTVTPVADAQVDAIRYVSKALQGVPTSAMPTRFPSKTRIDYDERLIRAKRPEALPVLQRMPNAHPY